MRSIFAVLLGLAACQTTAPTTENSGTAAAPATPAAELRATKWVLHSLNSQPVAPSATQQPYLQLSATEAQAEGLGGCNRFRGPAEVAAPNQLRFGPLLSTKMACPDLATESGFMGALQATRTYRISGDTLRLYSETGTTPAAELHRSR
ncbi:META domain-containing protein [Hymenobacter metallilatus]|uniref:META domain-containing protein n=1 Tax=Hymenobacter metallilatus TaxID=2493666 RepID=A0A428JC79_9BACT|nr:META domain-containing protein [Hymenobacter metallilatus]RSK29559.1 META domain-containing protein [Hymenobacter metallilatus]